MWICRTVGMLISTVNDTSRRSTTLLMVCRANPEGEPTGEPFVALDTVGAGEDDLVDVALGSAARETARTRGAPVDAAIVGIIDSTARRGSVLFRKGQDKPPDPVTRKG